MSAAVDQKEAKIAHKGRKCQWCGDVYHSPHPSKLFCGSAHQQAFANWCASRGKVLIPIALAWRTQRGKKGVGSDALKEMTRFLDQCAAELSEQGAPPIAKHFSATRSNGSGVSHWDDRERDRPSRPARPAPSAPAEA